MFIYREVEIRKADETAAQNGLSGNALMETAGRSLFVRIKEILNKNSRILILSGRGNNGGDGIVLARYLNQWGYNVDLVFPFGEPKSDSASEHFRYYKSLGYSWSTSIGDGPYDVIIDALLGVGTRLPLNQSYQDLLKWCNQQHALKIAIDLPTGVLADRGEADIAFHADYTFSLHGFKPSTFLLPSSTYFGQPESIDIGLPHDAKWKIWSEKDVKRTMKKRVSNSHKGTFGTGLLLAGTDEMPGSAMLAGLGAMKIGIGKLVIATTPYAASIIATRIPEATYLHDGLNKLAVGTFPDGIRAMAIGPGLTDEKLIDQVLENVWEKEIPLVIDAGALGKREFAPRKAPIIITPHPGEFSRLTGLSVKEIEANRLEISSQFALQKNVIVVLKGANTVIAFPNGTGFINRTGNAALAKGGSGDTLTGMILGLICSESDITSAIANAVYLHGLCADELVKEQNERSIVAGNITNVLGRVMNRLITD